MVEHQYPSNRGVSIGVVEGIYPTYNGSCRPWLISETQLARFQEWGSELEQDFIVKI